MQGSPQYLAQERGSTQSGLCSSLEASKARLGGALGSLSWWLATLPRTGWPLQPPSSLNHATIVPKSAWYDAVFWFQEKNNAWSLPTGILGRGGEMEAHARCPTQPPWQPPYHSPQHFPTHSSEQTPHCRPLKPSSDTREPVLPPKTHLMFVLIQNQVGPMKPTPQLCLS